MTPENNLPQHNTYTADVEQFQAHLSRLLEDPKVENYRTIDDVPMQQVSVALPTKGGLHGVTLLRSPLEHAEGYKMRLQETNEDGEITMRLQWDTNEPSKVSSIYKAVDGLDRKVDAAPDILNDLSKTLPGAIAYDPSREKIINMIDSNGDRVGKIASNTMLHKVGRAMTLFGLRQSSRQTKAIERHFHGK